MTEGCHLPAGQPSQDDLHLPRAERCLTMSVTTQRAAAVGLGWRPSAPPLPSVSLACGVAHS